jgi:uncharacterized protein DUF5678
VTDPTNGPELEVPDQPVLGPDDLEHYTGEWVAMRGGRVVAHHPDSEQLRLDPEVMDTDDIFPVGEPPSGFYLINV